MSEDISIIIRPMLLVDIRQALHLSIAEGWNQTEKDWKRFVDNPQNTCLVAESDNKVIGTVTAMNYSDAVAWIGMVLVDREYRGRGISKLLLTDIFQKLKSCRSIKLDATPAGQPVYKKFGFEDEYIIDRLTNLSIKWLSSDQNDTSAKPVHLEDIQELAAFDKFIFGVDRTPLIKSLIQENPDKAWLLKRNNQIAGFTLGRVGNKYHHIGPVFAASFVDACILITESLKKLNNLPVVVDALHDKSDLIGWLNSIGFIKQRQFIRMYKKKNPYPGITGNQFLICGPEFG